MPLATILLNSIRATENGLTLTELLILHPNIPRRTAQRLAWRDFIKQTIRDVITHPELEPLSCIAQAVAKCVSESEQADVQALAIEELRRLHEGVLARYGLRPSQYTAWKAVRGH